MGRKMSNYQQIAEKAMDRYYVEVAKVGAVPNSFDVTSEEFAALLRNNDIYQNYQQLSDSFIWHLNNGSVIEVVSESNKGLMPITDLLQELSHRIDELPSSWYVEHRPNLLGDSDIDFSFTVRRIPQSKS
jgi:hypothetical protein